MNKSVEIDTMLCDMSWSSKVQEAIETFENPMKIFFDNFEARFLMN
jgi:hypothetical protein